MSVAIRLSLLTSVVLALATCKPAEPPLKDGEYYGYQFISNLSPEEDPYAAWFYAGILNVRGGSVTLKQFPRYVSHDKLTFSASDGGFPEYDGHVELVGDRTIVALRKVACDYCGVPVDDPLPSKIVREYIVRFVSDGSFELNGVMYSAQKNSRLERDPKQ